MHLDDVRRKLAGMLRKLIHGAWVSNARKAIHPGWPLTSARPVIELWLRFRSFKSRRNDCEPVSCGRDPGVRLVAGDRTERAEAVAAERLRQRHDVNMRRGRCS